MVGERTVDCAAKGKLKADTLLWPRAKQERIRIRLSVIAAVLTRETG
ncbi:MAG: hypothetical protein C1O27_002579 [Chloroflexi bacterium]|nr:MAG: hypothetical protein C1O27_002579 [Chloroflexota bacterium]